MHDFCFLGNDISARVGSAKLSKMLFTGDNDMCEILREHCFFFCCFSVRYELIVASCV